MKIYLFLILCMMTDCLAEVQDDEKNSHIFTPRKGKYHLLYLLGGLQGLVAFVILKIKIVLVVITIIGATVLALKFLSVFKYSNYVYKSHQPIDELPAIQYGQPSPHDSYEYKDDWLAPSPYDRVNRRDDSNDFIDGFLVKVEAILLPLMNFSNKQCQHRTICQFTIVMTSSLDFSECDRIYPECREIPETTPKKRIRH
ncbi:uncharacterized protein [Fopius arisanus]|uniref:Uncharacterized protein isoform X2 n=1 Tax=Fopius arisanus TaxID=64838 RepID=A0A9R1U1R5_9HYME|nr:PREDICTED: uncharacterized protein LOC105267310 isoform X2 [Fopius arisanus]